MKRNYNTIFALALLIISAAFSSCSKTKSYSELLRTEEKAVNWFMAKQRVVSSIPADSIFEYGENAPYYRMDDDGYIYMQVVNPGNQEKKATKNQLIYFRYLRTNILEMYNGLNPTPSGNANNVGTGNACSFRFDNTELASSLSFGSGLQVPLRYLGLDCEVNIVIRSYYGLQSEIGACQPYLYNVKYYPAQF